MQGKLTAVPTARCLLSRFAECDVRTFSVHYWMGGLIVNPVHRSIDTGHFTIEVGAFAGVCTTNNPVQPAIDVAQFRIGFASVWAEAEEPD